MYIPFDATKPFASIIGVVIGLAGVFLVAWVVESRTGRRQNIK